MFVTDRNGSLIKAITELFSMAQRGYCVFHLFHNVKLIVKHDRDEVASQFRHIVTIYSEIELERRYAGEVSSVW